MSATSDEGKPRWTPGPWTVYETIRERPIYGIETLGGDLVARTVYREADARLIAAAPAMAEAIRDQIAWIERLLQILEHRLVTNAFGEVVYSFAAAIVPDWDLRQKLDSLKDNLRLAEEGGQP